MEAVPTTPFLSPAAVAFPICLKASMSRRDLRAALLVCLSLFAVAPAVAQAEVAYPAYSFTDSIGVNVHLADPGTPYYNASDLSRAMTQVNGPSGAAKVQMLLAALGVKHIRNDLCPTTRSAYCAKALALTRKLYADNGIKSLDAYYSTEKPSLTALPGHAEIDKELALAADPANVNAIDGLEGTNEVDFKKLTDWAGKISDQQAYVQQQIATKYPQLAGKTLLNPSIASAAGANTLAAWKGSSVFPSWDSSPIGAVNAHAYFFRNTPEAAISNPDGGCVKGQPNWLACSNEIAPGKPIWMTETGYTSAINTTEGVSQVAQGTYLLRDLLENARLKAQTGQGWDRTYIYELLDSRSGLGCSPSLLCSFDRESGFGLVKANYGVKPAYLDLQRLMSVLGDPSKSTTAASLDLSVAPADQNTVRRLLFRQGDGSYVLALWRPVSVFTPSKVSWTGVSSGRDIPEGTAPNTTADATITLPSAMTATVYRPGTSAAPIDTQAASTTHTVTVHGDVVLVKLK
ncbi:MAG: hypothetical protein AAGC46_02035 [Solirubrobacteraceae bacterium]|nr:hypothetical protein [Patulibacter sp.]